MNIKTERTWIWIHRVIVLLMGVFIPLTGFMFKTASDKFNEYDTSIRSIQLEQARSGVGRFTAESWHEQKKILDAQAILTERRITRLEEAVPSIKESLVRIENKIDKNFNN